MVLCSPKGRTLLKMWGSRGRLWSPLGSVWFLFYCSVSEIFNLKVTFMSGVFIRCLKCDLDSSH